MKKELNFYLMNYFENIRQQIETFSKANENVQSFCENERKIN